MTKEQFAEMLNGSEYRNEISRDQAKIAKDHNLLVCFGASDDLLEMRGIINDELGAWDGCTAVIYKNKQEGYSVKTLEEFKEIQEILDDNDIDFSIPTISIEAEWSPKEPECSWLIKTALPHASFDILEEGDLYCRGIVISGDDILKYLP